MPSKRNRPTYAGWTDPGLKESEQNIDSVLNKFWGRKPEETGNLSVTEVEEPIASPVSLDTPLEQQTLGSYSPTGTLDPQVSSTLGNNVPATPTDPRVQQPIEQQVSAAYAIPQEHGSGGSTIPTGLSVPREQHSGDTKIDTEKSLLRSNTQKQVTRRNTRPGGLSTPQVSDTRGYRARATHIPRGTTDPQDQQTPGYIDPIEAKFLKIPNVVFDYLPKVLDSYEFNIYLRLFRLSYGFNKTTCLVGYKALAEGCGLSDRYVRRAIPRLVSMQLISIIAVYNDATKQGTLYEVHIPEQQTRRTNRPEGTSEPREQRATIKDHDHEDLKIHDHHQSEVMTIYTQLTGKNWTKTDQRAYEQIRHLPVEQLASEMSAISERSSAPIGSFAYFATSIKNAVAEGKGIGQAAAARRRIEEWAAQLRHAHVGDGSYSISDLSEDLKDRCAREGIEYTAELINEIISRR